MSPSFTRRTIGRSWGGAGKNRLRFSPAAHEGTDRRLPRALSGARRAVAGLAARGQPREQTLARVRDLVVQERRARQRAFEIALEQRAALRVPARLAGEDRRDLLVGAQARQA